ncbi:MAG: hypothetical protein RQ763_11235 [Sulfurimonas sp.]|uniref:hypothetical protein n=1 Tax=Sulfurimonas sp. TaxID=2022749 RepID=UPI0028CFC99E|nr:hypothetical protein [Sulfurimonas sp.]MDT8339756.1 hypothetical protein [Sulfurimonas sp.]
MSELIMNYIEQNKDIINIISLPLSLLAFIVGFATLIYTIKMVSMKKGIDVRCSYSLCSSIECEDKYISDFILENRKDKSIVLFQIYLKLGHNYYLELEDFEHAPLIIKPFEVYSQSFDPLLSYSVSMKRIKLDKLFDNPKVKKKILLYTTEGVYEVKAHINMSHPISLFFKNYATAVIKTNRLKYDDKAYGMNIKYLVEFTHNDGKKNVLALREDSYRTKFKNLTLNKESLRNKENLEIFFQEKLDDNILKNITKINVIDFKKEIQDYFENTNTDKIIEAEYYGFFKYYVVGKIVTIIKNIDVGLKNYFRNNPRGKKLRSLFHVN